MKFVYMRSTYSLGVLKKWLKLDLHQMKQLVSIICVENGLDTFRTTRDEICLIAFDLQSNGIKFVWKHYLRQVMNFV